MYNVHMCGCVWCARSLIYFYCTIHYYTQYKLVNLTETFHTLPLCVCVRFGLPTKTAQKREEIHAECVQHCVRVNNFQFNTRSSVLRALAFECNKHLYHTFSLIRMRNQLDIYCSLFAARRILICGKWVLAWIEQIPDAINLLSSSDIWLGWCCLFVFIKFVFNQSATQRHTYFYSIFFSMRRQHFCSVFSLHISIWTKSFCLFVHGTYIFHILILSLSLSSSPNDIHLLPFKYQCTQ